MGKTDFVDTAHQIQSKRINRRAFVKASLLIGATASLSATHAHLGGAQSSNGTRAATWYETRNDPSVEAKAAAIVPAEFTFFAIAPHWSDQSEPDVQIRISCGRDGTTWEPVVTVTESSADAGRPDRDNRRFGDLLFTNGANFFRYETVNSLGEPIEVNDLGFTYIDASDGPTVDDLFSPAAAPSLDRPPIISRSMWGADERYRHENNNINGPLVWPLEYQTVEHIIIHHTVTPNSQDPVVAIRSIYYYHAITRGWGDIGYNYLVDYLGNIYEGRAGGTNVVGGHALQYNYGSSGIAAMGTFSSTYETAETRSALIWIASWIGRHLDPFGRSNFHQRQNLPTICGHRDVGDTDCPGAMLYADLDQIRSGVASVLGSGTTPSTNQTFAAGDIVSVNTDALNLRSGRSTTAGIIATLPYGTVLQIVDGPASGSGYTWYQVRGDAGTGWCVGDFLTRSGASTPPRSSLNIGDRVTISTDALNLRSGPGLNYGVAAIAKNGTQGTITDGPTTANGYNWFKLTTADGNGWGVDLYLVRSSASTSSGNQFSSGDYVVVTTDALNLRSSAGATRSVLATMSNGTQLTITGGPTTADGYTWYPVTSPTYGNGWCVSQFLALTQASTPTGKFQIGDRLVVNTDGLNFRSRPGTTGALIGTMLSGTQVTVVDGPQSSSGYIWYQVQSTYGTGWCVEDYLARSSSSGFASGATVFVNTDALNLRSEGRSSAAIRAVMPSGSRLTIVSGPITRDNYDWYQVSSTTYGSGWCVGSFLSPISSGNTGFTNGTSVRVVDGPLNMRSSPSVTGSVIGSVANGARLTITGGPTRSDGYTWYKVRSNSIGDGYCAGEFLEPI